MRKAIGYLEIIFAVVLVGAISNMVIGTSKVQKSKADTTRNFNYHLVLDAEVSQNRQRALIVLKKGCHSFEDVNTEIENVNGVETCKITYKIKDFTNNDVDIESYVYKADAITMRVFTTLSVKGIGVSITSDAVVTK